MAIKPKFFQLTNDLRNLLLLIKSIGGDYPHQSLVDMTLSSNQYHKYNTQLKFIMTESQEIEEILMESHSYGLRVEVMEAASKIMRSTPTIRRVDAYHKAFHSIIVQ